MKRIFALFLACLIIFTCIACAAEQEENDPKHHKMIKKAISTLKDQWTLEYKKLSATTDMHFEIKNTRVITLKETDIEVFSDVAYIIEFVLFTDYYGCAPYYENMGYNDTVIVYRSGIMKVSNNLIRAYRQQTFKTDYSDIIESVDDYDDRYNCSEKLK